MFSLSQCILCRCLTGLHTVTRLVRDYHHEKRDNYNQGAKLEGFCVSSHV